MGGFYWIASYPKSGNTWVRLMLASLVKGGAPLDFAKPIGFAPSAAATTKLDLYLNVETSELTPDEAAELLPDLYVTTAREEPEPQFRKVHDSWGRTPSGRLLFPPECTLGSIYILRDPRDVAVSWAHHADLSLDEAIAFLGNGEACVSRGSRWKDQLAQRLGSWSTHVASWMAAVPSPLVVTYERLSTDPATVLAEAASRCGIEATDDAIAKVVAATRFDRLQEVEKVHGFEIGQKPGRNFFRKGMAGGWRDTLSPEQVRRIETDHREMMACWGYI